MSQYVRYPASGPSLPLSQANGGTGISTSGTSNQLLGENNAASSLEYKTLAGTANQVTVTPGANLITLALPQSIATTSNPTFAALTVSTINGGTSSGNNSGDVSLDTANGLTLVGQVLSLPTSANSTFGKLTVTASSAVSLTNLTSNLTPSGTGTIDVRGADCRILNGYTGSTAIQIGVSGVCTSAATGIDLNNLYMNAGVSGISNGTGTGLNIGVFSYAKSSDLSVGGFFSTDGSRTNAKYIGVIGVSNNTSSGATRIGGYFASKTLGDFVGAGNFPSGVAALIADNDGGTDDIFKGRDNGTDVFRIMDGGTIGTNQMVNAATPGTVIKKLPIYNESGTLIGYIPVYDAIT